MSNTPGKLSSTFVVTGPSLSAETIEVSDTIWQDIDKRFGDFAGRTLISSFSFDAPWPTWEMHPAGDEIVCLLEGDVELTLAETGGDRRVRLSQPGEFVVVPKGVWHTAAPNEPTSMLFVTPGEGTENREQPRRPADTR